MYVLFDKENLYKHSGENIQFQSILILFGFCYWATLQLGIKDLHSL